MHLRRMLPTDVLAKLDAMDEYDRMLAFGRVGNENRMSAADVEAQYNAWKNGGSVPDSFVSARPTTGPPTKQTANYIQDASRYRPSYDPSREGRARQSQIEQAVMCPHCDSALGIPSTRPIKVKCPSCLMESTFES